MSTNAKQMHCTGVLVVFTSVNVVVVEGGPKAIKFMKKLMLRRMDWNDSSEAEVEGEDDKNSAKVRESVDR